jgi:hypothetical protein
MASGVVVAVVGATGAAGQTTLRILEERKFPVRELRCFASERSVGKTVTFAGETVTVQRIEPAAFKGVDVAICSAGSAQAREFAPMIVKAPSSSTSPTPGGWIRRSRSSCPRSTLTPSARIEASWPPPTARRS